MVRVQLAGLAALAALVLPAQAQSHRAIQQRPAHFLARQSQSILQSDYTNGATAPGAREGDAPGQTVVINGNGGHDSNSQRAGCDTVFIGTAEVGGSFSDGWQSMPQVLGFDTMRDLKVSGDVVQPYIMETGKDPSKIKRVIIVQPGLPRDYWKYSNLVRNSLLCAAQNQTAGIDLSTILIVAPAWLTTADQSAGAAQENDLLFRGAGWSTGSRSVGPGSASVSSFDVLDMMTAKFFDKSAYPNVNQIYIAGHSLGGSTSQRYAVLRKPTDDDANLNYFVGNPGAYVWPVTERPISNPSGGESCAAQVNDWPYGLSSLPEYASSESDTNAIAQRYYSRNVVYGLGLSDEEGGDTHCEAQYEGNSHLSRGQNLEKALQGLPGGVPATHKFNYVQGVAHEDYLILSDPVSQHYLFSDKIDTREGSSSATPSSTKSGKSSSQTNTGATASPTSSNQAGNQGSGAAPGSSVSGYVLAMSLVAAIFATASLSL